MTILCSYYSSERSWCVILWCGSKPNPAPLPSRFHGCIVSFHLILQCSLSSVLSVTNIATIVSPCPWDNQNHWGYSPSYLFLHDPRGIVLLNVLTPPSLVMAKPGSVETLIGGVFNCIGPILECSSKGAFDWPLISHIPSIHLLHCHTIPTWWTKVTAGANGILADLKQLQVPQHISVDLHSWTGSWKHACITTHNSNVSPSKSFCRGDV